MDMSNKGSLWLAVNGAVAIECQHGWDACPTCDADGAELTEVLTELTTRFKDARRSHARRFPLRVVVERREAFDYASIYKREALECGHELVVSRGPATRRRCGFCEEQP